MRGFFVASLFSLGALAAPALTERGIAACIDNNDASQIANAFADLIRLPFNTTLAKNFMTTNFHDYSDSVIELIDSGCSGPVALGSATFSSRKSFIAGQSGQPPIPFDILNTWHNCDTVFLRWRSPNPGTVNPEQQVTGIIAIETVPNPRSGAEFPFKAETVYSEFNSGAWLYDLGVFTPSNCNSASKRDVANPFIGML